MVEGLEGRQLLAGQAVGVALVPIQGPPPLAADPAPTLTPPPGTQTLTGVGVDILARTGSPIARTTFARFTYFLGDAGGGGILDANGDATIDYGDGTTPEVGITHATVGPDGVATIPVVAFLEHVYAHAGTYTIHVTYTYAGNPPSGTTVAPVTATTTGTATVADDANVPDGSIHGTGVDVLAKTGDPMVSTPLADFPAPIGAWGDATIDYGDGTPAQPGLVGFSGPYGANVYVISGQGHIYAHAGTYAIRVTFSADGAPGAVTSTATVSDDANVPDGSIHGTGTDVVARTGTPIVPTVLARFTAPLGTWTDPMIDYGDGTPAVPGTLTALPSYAAGTYDVTGQGHVYAHPGSYTIRVTFSVDGSPGATTGTATVSDDANVPDGSIHGTGMDILAKTGDPIVSTPLARFTGPVWNLGVATIYYGDGTPPVAGYISPTEAPGGSTTVTGQGHTYAQAGTYTILVTYTVNGVTGTAKGTATVADDANVPDGSLHGTGTDILVGAGGSTAGLTLARFTNAAIGGWGGPTVDYGDGTPPTPGRLTGLPNPSDGNAYVISSQGHTYAHAGTYAIVVTFTVNGVTGTATSHAFVTGDPASAPVGGADGGAGQRLTYTPVIAPSPVAATVVVPPPIGPVALAPAPTAPAPAPAWLAAFLAKVEQGSHPLYVSYQSHPNGLLASRLSGAGRGHHRHGHPSNARAHA